MHDYHRVFTGKHVINQSIFSSLSNRDFHIVTIIGEFAFCECYLHFVSRMFSFVVFVYFCMRSTYFYWFVGNFHSQYNIIFSWYFSK